MRWLNKNEAQHIKVYDKSFTLYKREREKDDWEMLWLAIDIDEQSELRCMPEYLNYLPENLHHLWLLWLLTR